MPDEKPVFFHFDYNLAPGQARLDIRIEILDGTLLVLREFQVQLEGGEDLSLKQAWCALSGDGVNSDVLRVTANGAEVPPLRPPRLLLNHVVESTVPESGSRLFVIGPSHVYLPGIDEVSAVVVRYPATAAALAIVSATGALRPYEPDGATSG